MARSFIFGEGQRYKTPEELAKARAVANAMLMNSAAPRDVGSGLSAIGQALLYRSMMGDINASAKANSESAAASFNPIAAALGGPGAFPAAPGSSKVADALAGKPKADNPNLPSRMDFADKGNIASGIRDTASALGIDPVDLGTAISYETGGTFDPTKRGPTTQWGQHRGLIQFGEPQAKQFGVDWNNPVGSQLGPDGAVANYLRDAGVQPGMGMIDVYSAINAGRVGRYNASDANNGGAPGTVRDKVEQQMAGHRQKALALLGGDQSPAVSAVNALAGGATTQFPPEMTGADVPPAPTFVGRKYPAEISSSEVASLDPSIGLPPLQQTAPQLPAPKTIQDRPIAAMSAEQPMQVAQTGQFDPTQLPAAAGGTADTFNAANGPSLQMLARAAADPNLNDGQRNVVEMLMKQQMQRTDPEYQLDRRYRQAQIRNIESEIAKRNDPNARDKFGNNPVWGKDKDGKWVLFQLNNAGGLAPASAPNGVELIPPGVGQMDLGTSYGIRDRSGAVIGNVQKDVAGEAAEKEKGKSVGQAQFDLPRVEQNAQRSIDLLERMKTHPGRESSTGFFEGLLPARTQDQVDFQSLVDQTKGQAFLEAYNTLRGAGQITEVEGVKAENAISRLGNYRLGDAEYARAIHDLEDVISSGVTRARQQAGGGAAPTTSPPAQQPAQRRLRFNPATGELE